MTTSRWALSQLARLLRHQRTILSSLHHPLPTPQPATQTTAPFERRFPATTIRTTHTTTPTHPPPPHDFAYAPLLLPAGLLSFLAPRSDDEAAEESTPEGKLIMCIKRSILCVQRQQYDRAEQMLHLALRMAQDLQHQHGVTYVFDVMANLAMETEQFVKARKLFVQVMQRLLQDGLKEDDIKMLHISTKLAHMEALQGHLQSAELGFKWVLDKVQQKIGQVTAADEEALLEDLRELQGLTQDCYAQLLVQLGQFAVAKQLFADALATFTERHGRDHAEVVALLNNLAVVCTQLNELPAAQRYIEEALQLARKFPELFESGVYQANQGMVMMRQGLLAEAERVCKVAWRMAKKAECTRGVEQSDHCLKELRRMRAG